jgi:hypothetical protein
MTQQAVLLKEIDGLPPKYFEQVVDFVGYLRNKAMNENAPQYIGLTEEQRKREAECFRLHADELNREMAEVLLDQSDI